MTRYAIGDVQGCYEELRALIATLRFRSDRDQLWFVGDLVNRGPDSLQVLRLVRELGSNAVVVLGNHDLHLLALACGARRARTSDTLQEILDAPDRERLLHWLATRPLAHAERGDLLVHAGVVPQWDLATTLALAREVETALAHDPQDLFAHMYGDEPHRWRSELRGPDRLRFAINVLTRLRLCTADGSIELQVKGPPPATGELRPWFELPGRLTRDMRVVFGHWSALGYLRRAGVIGLDSGCVWGGKLTAVDLDAECPPVTVPCSGYQVPDTDQAAAARQAARGIKGSS